MRAISLRTARTRPVFSSWPLARWKRRLNCSFLSLPSWSPSSSVDLTRKSSAVLFFFLAILVSPSAVQPRHELGGDRQLRRAKPHGLLGRVHVDAIDLEQDAARLDLGHPEFRRAFSRAHANFRRLLRHRNIRKHANPDAAGALHLACDGTPRRLDLAGVDALGLQRLQAILAEIERGPGFGGAVDAALVLLSEVGACRLKDGSSPLLCCRLRALLLLLAAGGFRLALLHRHRIVLHDLALEDPDLDAAGAVGGLGGGDAIVDVGAQRVQRHAAFAVPFRAGDFSAAQPAAAIDADALGAQTHGGLHRALHHAAEGDAALELLGDVLRHQLGVDFRLADLDDVQMHLVAGVFLDFVLQLLDIGALLADHHARPRRVNGDAALLVRALDHDAADAGLLEPFRQGIADLDVFLQQLAVVLLAGIPP